MDSQKKIKVLFRLRSLEMGGVQKVMLDLMENLPKDKFEIALLLNLYQGELKTEIPNGIKIIYLAKGKEFFSKNSIIQKIQLILRRIKLFLFVQFPILTFYLKLKKKYDIEIASSYSEFDSVLNSFDKKSRKIAWFHTDVSYDKNKKRVMERIYKMQKFNHVVFCAAHIRNVITENFGISYPNSSVIYNAIHAEQVLKKSIQENVNLDLKYPIFCSVGRLHSRKGYHLLLKVHKKLIDEGLKHSVIILGDGEERENLKKQISEENLKETFHLLGTKSNPYPYIKNSDFFILPSQSEAYPLVINEALALQKPIISTNVGGIPEMIDDGKDGILVNFDENEIFEAMKRFLTEPELVKKIIEGTQSADEKFDEKKIYQQVTEVFEQQYKKLIK